MVVIARETRRLKMNVFERLSAAADRTYNSVRAWRTWLTVLFVVAALVRLACYTGIIGSDDLWYVRYAGEIASGQFPHHTNQFAARTGLTMAVSAAFRVFGISTGSTVLVPLLASSASVPLLADIGALLFGPFAGSLAALLLLTSPIHVRFATILVPEPLMEFQVLLGVWCYIHAARRGSRLLGVLAGITIGVAYLTKEPAAFVAPALVLAAWVNGRRWLAVTVAVGAIAIAGAETATYAVALHAPLHRIQSASAGVPIITEQDKQHKVVQRNWLVNRLFFVYPRRMVYPTLDFGLHFLVALILAALAVLALRRERTLLLLWAALPWMYLNFGSGSLMHYNPLYPSERYISPTLAPLFLLAAGLFVAPAAVRYRRLRDVGLFALVVVGIVGMACSLEVRATGFRTRQMAVLSSIATLAESKGLVPCHVADAVGNGHVDAYGDDRMDYWTDALRLFDPASANTADTRPHVRIDADGFGLPHTAAGTCERSPELDDAQNTEGSPE